MPCQYFSPCEQGADTFTVMMPKLTFGRGCLSELGERAKGRGFSRVALFTDPFLRDGPYVDTALRGLKKNGIDVAVFSDIRIEPDDKTFIAAAEFLRGGNFDSVVSVGGGSSMDTAKAGMVYALYPAEFTDYLGPPAGPGRPVPGPLLPHIACPTTSGTGSECTSVSVVRLSDLNTKFVLGSPYMLPDEALVDPACTDTLPANVIASTGYDLMCHAIECYTAKAYTRWDRVADPNGRTLLQGANPWSDMSARRALEIVDEYLVRGVSDATDSEARDQLMWGATLAGMAFGNSGTHLAHAMSYGVTHLMEDVTTEGYRVPSPFVPHGISVMVSAPAIFRFVAEGAPERHLEAASCLGAETGGATGGDAGEIVADKMIRLMRDTHAPNGLSGVGFGPKDIKNLAASSIRQTRAINNAPRIADQRDMENIYSAAISYW
ncbi:MAG: iron-containing alcohol dehydrogenase [Gammaproteobacteria bacterium]|nr:iron-containing alcohol dehydrogenase [Gammaproteobacteria bacterium]MYG65510.1 iron-containing alcohol dehydrogenase [Gammaproteobacteria bacterium]